jgi:cytochrome c biogenesis protein CcmG/thiol:disulfide interchange protein DsbE
MTATVRRTRARTAALGAVLAVALGGCLGGDEGDPAAGSKPPDYASALRGSPPPLAELHSRADELVPGGVDAFRAQLRELRGYPVVVNKWASWCGPCRIEFPFFQRQSAEHGKRVAFLGVDSNDSKDAARTFLERSPLSYPSFSDPESAIAAEMEVPVEFPATVFYDRHGKPVYVKRGGYASEKELAADIRRYARR